MNTQPIEVAVVFDAQGRVHLQRGAEDLDQFARRLERISTRTGTSGRVLRELENDLNRMGRTLAQRVTPALNLFNSSFERLHRLTGRFLRLGFYTIAAQFTAVSYAAVKLGKDFLQVNERFANLEITIRSVYGSLRLARRMRDEIGKLTVTSPLKFEEIANITRAMATIPSLSGRLAQQNYQPGGYSKPGFLQQSVRTVEQLTAFRPDKSAEDAVFAIREAVSGQMRSLQRRFEFPTELLTSASGKSLDYLKNNPNAMFDAITKALDKIISPQAIEQMTKQPTKLFQNLVEQLKDLPLLKIGTMGEDSGRSFYDRFLSFFQRALETSSNFISNRFDPYAKRISSALNKMFEIIFMGDNSIVERIMDTLSLGKSDLPGLEFIERFFEGVTRLTEKGAAALPSIMEGIKSLGETFIPIIKGIVDILLKAGKVLKALFETSPLLGGAGVLAMASAPALVRAGLSYGSRTAIGAAQAARMSLVSNTLSQNMHAPGIGQLNNLLATAGQGYSARTAGGNLVGINSLSGRQVNLGGYAPASIAGMYGLTGRTRWRQVLAAIQASGINSPVDNTFRGAYNVANSAAGSAGYGRIGSRLAGLAAGTTTALGGSARLAGNVATATLGAASLGASIMPIVMAITSTMAISAIVDAVQGEMSVRTLRKGRDAADSLGLKAEDINKAIERDTVFYQALRQTGQTTSMPVVYGSRDQQNSAQYLLERLTKQKDLSILNKGIRSGEFDFTLGSNPNNVIENMDEAVKAAKDIQDWLDKTSGNLQAVQLFAQKLGIAYGDRFSATEAELAGTLSGKLDALKSIPGIIEFFPELEKVSQKLASFSQSPGMITLLEDSQLVFEKLRNAENPFASLHDVLDQEKDYVTALLDVDKMISELDENAISGNYNSSVNDLLAKIRPLVKDKADQSLLTRAEALVNQGDAMAGEVIKQLTERLKGRANEMTANPFTVTLSLMTEMFENIGDMTDTMLAKRVSQTVEAMTRIADRQDELGQNSGPMRSAIAAIQRTTSYRTGDGKLSQAELHGQKIGRLDSFYNALGFFPFDDSNAGNLQYIKRRTTDQTDEERQRESLRQMMEASSNRMQIPNVLRDFAIDGSGPAASALRASRMAQFNRLNVGNNYNLSPQFLSAMGLDPSGARGPEAQLSQAKAQSAMFSSFAAIDSQKAQSSTLVEDVAKYQQLAETWNELANSADKLVKSIEGQGDALKSFSFGVTSVLSEWKSQMQNFTEIGASMMQNFADGISTSLTSIIMKSQNAKEAFRDFALSFIESAVKMLMHKAVTMMLGAALGGLGGAAAATTNIGFATATGGAYANGGVIPGRPSKNDNVLIHAATGEYIIPTPVVQKYGVRFFDNLVKGGNFTSKVPHYATGGVVGGAPLPQGSTLTPGGVQVNVSVVVNNQDGTVTSEVESAQQGEMIGRGLRMAIQEEMYRQQRQGGMFRKR
jgi:hypothetical protein